MDEINQSKSQNKDVLLVYCATAIKSSEYWLPKENGGIGIGSRIIMNQSSNGRVNLVESAKSIAAGDALGLSSYFTGGAFFGLAAAGPAAILGGAVFAGAFGSAIVALQ